MTAREPNADSNKNTAVLIPRSQITAGVKGGKLNVISRPRLRKVTRSSNTFFLALALISSRYPNPAFRQGHERSASLALGIDSPHRKDDIILAEVHSRARNVSYSLCGYTFPAGCGSGAGWLSLRPSRLSLAHFAVKSFGLLRTQRKTAKVAEKTPAQSALLFLKGKIM